jgi:hypothetical protein
MSTTYKPKKPSGRSAVWIWRRWIWDLLQGGDFPIKGDGNIVVQWINGFYRVSMKPVRNGGSSGPSQFTVVSDGGDYYNCYTWINGTAGTVIIKVAKHQDICCILPTATPAGMAWPSKVIRGITYTYVYTATAGTTTDGVNVIEYTRGVTGSDMSSSTSQITPCLNVGDIITADPFSFTTPATLKGIQWIARADGRAWADPDPDDE